VTRFPEIPVITIEMLAKGLHHRAEIGATFVTEITKRDRYGVEPRAPLNSSATTVPHRRHVSRHPHVVVA